MNRELASRGIVGDYASADRSFGPHPTGTANNKKTPEIDAKVAEINRAMSGIQQGLATLADRLIPVSRQDLKAQAGLVAGSQTPTDTSTPLGGTLDSMAHAGHRLSDEVQDIIRRLEI